MKKIIISSAFLFFTFVAANAQTPVTPAGDVKVAPASTVQVDQDSKEAKKSHCDGKKEKSSCADKKGGKSCCKKKAEKAEGKESN